MGLVQDVAGESLSVSFDDLPSEDVHHVKRLLLDSLGCIFGGRDHNESVEALLRSLPAIGGPLEAGVFMEREKSSALNATLVNGAMLRFLDMNDVQSGSELVPGTGHGHNSEIFPGVIALAEREGLGGRDIITATWLGYELATRFTECVLVAGPPSLEQRGWNMDLRASFAMPVVAGYLLGLDAAQIEHAVGIALSRGLVLGVVDHPAEKNAMAKNVRFPMGAHLGIMSTYLAGNGMTGPMRALEGGAGFVETVLGGAFDVEHFVNAGWRSQVGRAAMKRFAACNAQSGHLSATLDLILEHDLKPEQVEAVDVRTTTRGAAHVGDPSRRHPTDKETADHSTYYVQGALIVDRELGPAQYTPEKLVDPEIHRIADVVSIEGDPEFDALYPSARVTIRLKDGSVLEQYVGTPPGAWNNPLSDADIEAKFRSLSRGRLSEQAMDTVIDAVWRLDEFDDASTFVGQVLGV